MANFRLIPMIWNAIDWLNKIVLVTRNHVVGWLSVHTECVSIDRWKSACANKLVSKVNNTFLNDAFTFTFMLLHSHSTFTLCLSLSMSLSINSLNGMKKNIEFHVSQSLNWLAGLPNDFYSMFNAWKCCLFSENIELFIEIRKFEFIPKHCPYLKTTIRQFWWQT